MMTLVAMALIPVIYFMMDFLVWKLVPRVATGVRDTLFRQQWDSLAFARRLIVAGSKSGILATLSRDELGLLLKRVRWSREEQRERLAKGEVRISCPQHHNCFSIGYLPQFDIYTCMNFEIPHIGSYAYQACPRCVRPMRYKLAPSSWKCACRHTEQTYVTVFDKQTGRWERHRWQIPDGMHPAIK